MLVSQPRNRLEQEMISASRAFASGVNFARAKSHLRTQHNIQIVSKQKCIMDEKELGDYKLYFPPGKNPHFSNW